MHREEGPAHILTGEMTTLLPEISLRIIPDITRSGHIEHHGYLKRMKRFSPPQIAEDIPSGSVTAAGWNSDCGMG